MAAFLHSSSNRLLKALLVLLIIFAEIKAYRWWTNTDSSSERTPAWVAGSGAKLGLRRSAQEGGFLRKRIMVATSFGAHGELIKTFLRLAFDLPYEAIDH